MPPYTIYVSLKVPNMVNIIDFLNLEMSDINGSQVNWYSEFTKSLIFRDFDDVLKNPLDMWIFSYYTHYYQK